MKTTTTPDPIPADLVNAAPRQQALEVAKVRQARAEAKTAESMSTIVDMLVAFGALSLTVAFIAGVVTLIRWIA